MIKYLLLDGTDYKTISSGVLTKVCSTSDADTVVESGFKTNGMNDLSSFDNSIASQIANNTFQIVMYKA